MNNEPTLKARVNGESRQVPVSEVDEKALVWYRDKCKSTNLKQIAIAELARRGTAGPGASGNSAPAQNTAMTKAPSPPPGMSLERVAHDPQAITDRLTEYAAKFHMVTPATTVEALPPGFGVSISLVHVNTDDTKQGPGEIYSVGGSKVGLAGSKLLEISTAAGVDWSPIESGRLDSGQEPRYVHFRSVGYVRQFDGSIRRLMGEVEIDARDGSPQIEELITKAKKATDRNGNPEPRDPTEQILRLRKFILREAETKSKLRAIASMGVKRSYNKSELQKPFAVARLTWTGHSDDPELRREFARMGAERMLDGVGALFGRSQHPQLPQRRPLVEEFQGHEPPPVNSQGEVEELEDSEALDVEASGEEY